MQQNPHKTTKDNNTEFSFDPFCLYSAVHSNSNDNTTHLYLIGLELVEKCTEVLELIIFTFGEKSQSIKIALVN